MLPNFVLSMLKQVFIAGLMSGLAMAQTPTEQQTQDAQEPPAAQEEKEDIENIVVVGSR